MDKAVAASLITYLRCQYYIHIYIYVYIRIKIYIYIIIMISIICYSLGPPVTAQRITFFLLFALFFAVFSLFHCAKNTGFFARRFWVCWGWVLGDGFGEGLGGVWGGDFGGGWGGGWGGGGAQ